MATVGMISSAFLIPAAIKRDDSWLGAKVGAFEFYESSKQNHSFADIARARFDAVFARF